MEFKMTTLTQASRQWASRPADERFLSLIELRDHVQEVRRNSASRSVSSRSLTCVPVENDTQGLCVVGPTGQAAALTHWSFGQLAARAGAPAGYMRGLPAPLAADCMNYGLHHERDIADLGVLLHRGTEGTQLRAVTGPSYGRIWNSTVADALVNRFGDGITGDFRVPGEFGKAIVVNRENTTLYASDRDMFVFLADENNKIEVPNRRDGQPGFLSRGFFFWNSEVGAQTLGVGSFLFDYTCSNRMVWGAEKFSEIRIRHTSGAPDRLIEEVYPALQKMVNSGTGNIVQAIADAKAARIGDQDAVTKFLEKRFTKSQASAIKAAHMADEQRPIETLWDAVTGTTAYARGVSYQDERIKLEREAGKMMA